MPALDPPENSEDALLHVARLERYAGGVLAFGRHVYGEPTQLWPKWHTGVYYLADPGAELEWVQRPDCEEIHDALTLGETTHWLCRNREDWVVLDETAGDVVQRSFTREAEFLRLGSHGDALLVLSDRAIYRFEDRAWRPVYRRDEPWFDAEATTPRQHDDQLYYFASGLVRIDLSSDPSSIAESGYTPDWCQYTLLRPYYGRWVNYCYAITPSSDGGLWITGGHRFRSTLALLRDDEVKLAVFDGSVDRAPEYHEGLLHTPELDEGEFRRQISASAVIEQDGIVYLAGELGIEVVRSGRVEPLVRFDVPRQARTDVSSSLGPRDMALFDGSLSFALRVGALAVVRATDSGYALRWPKKP